MKLQELAKLSIGIVANQAAITIGTGNKVTLSNEVAKTRLGYKEGDVLYIDRLVRDEETYDVIACLPPVEGIKTFAFNKGVLSFGDKLLAETLGGFGAEWNVVTLFDTIELEDRNCSLLIIEQREVILPTKVEPIIEKVIEVVETPKVTPKVTPTIEIKPVEPKIITNTEPKYGEEEFESEAPELEGTPQGPFGNLVK